MKISIQFLLFFIFVFCFSCNRHEISKKKPPNFTSPVKRVSKVSKTSKILPQKPDSPHNIPPDSETPTVPIPRTPEPLEVKGWKPASHAGPDNPQKNPMPVVIVLHGNYDRPEWECDTWKGAAGFYGWILCPRGNRTPYASLSEDRWTYKNPKKVKAEINAALKALSDKYRDKVTQKGLFLVGFSLGAIYAPGLILKEPGKYQYLFMVEGGLGKLNKKTLKRLKKAGIVGLGLAMSSYKNIARAKKIIKIAGKIFNKVVFVNMRGSGHGYSQTFEIDAKKAIAKMVSTKP